MSEWICFLHPPRDDFAATCSDEELAAFDAHWEYVQQLFDDGIVILAGPTLGRINTGVLVFRADDEAAATRIMNADPTVSSGIVRGELRPYRLSLLEGRDRTRL